MKIAEEIRYKYLRVLWFFVEHMEHAPNAAKEDAINFISHISDELIDKFIEKMNICAGDSSFVNDVEIINSDLKKIKRNGQYEVPFKLLRLDENGVSMGNKGFAHPCYVEVKNSKIVLKLRARKIIHKSMFGQKLLGKLNKLYYWNGQTYLTAEAEDDIYSIPIFDVSLPCDKCSKLQDGSLMLKLYSSVGTINMPESEAKLRLNIASRKRIS